MVVLIKREDSVSGLELIIERSPETVSDIYYIAPLSSWCCDGEFLTVEYQPRDKQLVKCACGRTKFSNARSPRFFISEGVDVTTELKKWLVYWIGPTKGIEVNITWES